MADILVRMGEKPFYDNKAFHRGFAKSGNFTIVEEELLIHYGHTLEGLESGNLQPESSDEQSFLSVLTAPETAQSKLEKVWLKYIKLARGRKTFHTLNTKKPVASQSLVELSDDPSDSVFED